MPYWGLVATSLGFLAPSAWAWRGRAWVDAGASVVLAISSVAYHGTQHRVAQAVDMVVAHSCAVIGVGRSLMGTVRRGRGARPLALMLGGVGVYIGKSRNNPLPSSARWHMLFHVLCQSAWVAHLRAARQQA